MASPSKAAGQLMARSDSAVWPEEVERLLIKWADHAKAYVFMHAAVEGHNRAVDRWAHAVLTTLGVLVGVITGVGRDWSGGDVTANWLYGCAFIAITLIQALLRSLGYPEAARAHGDLGARWGRLQSKAELALAWVPETLEGKHALLQEVTNEHDDLAAASAGRIPAWAHRRLQRADRDKDMALPELSQRKLQKTERKLRPTALLAAAGDPAPAIASPLGAAAASAAALAAVAPARDVEGGSAGFATPGPKSGATASYFGPGAGISIGPGGPGGPGGPR